MILQTISWVRRFERGRHHNLGKSHESYDWMKWPGMLLSDQERLSSNIKMLGFSHTELSRRKS